MKFNIVSQNFVGSTKEFAVENLIGGQEIYLLDLAKFLIKEGNDVTVIQSGDSKEELEFEGIKIKKVAGSAPFRMRWKSALDRDADKIHLHDFELAFPNGKDNMTATCHGVTWDCPASLKHKNMLYWSVHNFYHRFMASQGIKKLEKIASVDSFLLRYVQSKMPENADKIKVILSYVRTESFNPNVSGKEVKAEYGSRPIVLFPRNLSFVRGPMLMVKAVEEVKKQFPDVALLVMGNGPMRGEVEKYVRGHGLEGNVIFVGHKDHFKDMPAYYSAADAVVVPSLCREGCSLACLEAMAVQKPVVATNVGGLPDIITDSENGLLSETNSTDLAENIAHILSDKEDAKRLARNGYDWVWKNHTYEKWCLEYKEFFNL
jgi:glycosyltransferase involved in cell wall biosynthesis